MRRLPLIAVCIGLPALLLGCGKEPPEGTTRIALTRGATLSISVDTGGNVKIVATIPQGVPGTGTYTSTDVGLTDEARSAKDTLNDPGVKTSIEVKGSRLVAVGSTSTK